jgi:hypothetical protein
MSNSYYNHSIYPTPNAPGSSAALRAELDLITAGFNLLPTLSGNGYKVAMVNAGGTALIASSALQSLAITSSTIDSTPIGATTRAAGSFTNLSVNGTAGLGSSVTISGGTINNTIIGGTTPVAGFFTTLSATSGLTGNVTGNLTGNVTGNVLGNLTGNVTGNVTATSGTSQFNNVTINGQLDMDAGSSATIINLPNPTNNGDAANKAYVDTQDALKLSLTGGTMSGAIAMGTNKITGLGTPTADADAATKAYVDQVAQGLDVKASVRVATTANITLSGTQTIDGVAVIAGDRVLVKDQSTGSQNGVYVVAAGSWSRSSDMDAWTEFPGAFVFVEQGTVNDNSGWVCTVSQGGTLGVTTVTWEQFSGAGQITAGTGMTKTGNTLNVNTASASRIVVGADEIDLATTGVSAGTYRSVTVDLYGRVTAGTNPTTLAGYGIVDAYTIAQVDSALALKLNLSGGTMSGQINMGTNRITNMADPSSAQDAATKNYIDTIFGSTTSAAASASAAATSATNAANSATSASGSATTATNAANAAAASYDDFDDRYLGPKTSNPTVDNDGNPLQTGALYFNTSAGEMRVWNGSSWVAAYLPAAGYVSKTGDTMTGELAINVNSSNAALRVTQSGSGFVIQVEDTSSDTTPFVVRADGRTVIGGTTNYGIAGLTNPQLTVNESEAVISAVTWNGASSGFNASLQLNRSRSSTQGSYTVVQSGDLLGAIRFGGDDGTQFIRAADIFAVVDGTPGAGDMPGRLILSTTADGASSPTERIRIDSSGRVGFATTTSPLAYIDIRGNKAPTNGTTLDAISSAFTANDVTTVNATSFTSFIGPGDSVALTGLTHFAAAQRSFGAGASATTQTGYEAASSLTGATTNYGFRGRIATGTNRWNLFMDGTASNHLAGPLGINTTFLNDYLLRIGGNITGAVTRGAAEINVTAQSDVTSEARGLVSAVSTAATSFTVGQTSAFFAAQGTIGAGSTVTTQVGYLVSSSFTGGTNNYGFRGAIASGSNRFNLYMDGTAANFLAGGLIINNNLGVGSAGSPNYGSAGQALVSNGAGAAPSWGSAGISTGKAIAMAIVFG